MEQTAEQTWDIVVPTLQSQVVKTSSKAVFDAYMAYGFCGLSEAYRNQVYPDYQCPIPVVDLVDGAVTVALASQSLLRRICAGVSYFLYCMIVVAIQCLGFVVWIGWIFQACRWCGLCGCLSGESEGAKESVDVELGEGGGVARA